MSNFKWGYPVKKAFITLIIAPKGLESDLISPLLLILQLRNVKTT